MVSSMTAFARESLQLPSGTLTVELRSVNYRYLDIHVGLPPGWEFFSAKVHRCLKKKLKPRPGGMQGSLR